MRNHIKTENKPGEAPNPKIAPAQLQNNNTEPNKKSKNTIVDLKDQHYKQDAISDFGNLSINSADNEKHTVSIGNVSDTSTTRVLDLGT